MHDRVATRHEAARQSLRKQRLRAGLRAGELLLAGVGLVCLLIYFAACADRGLFQWTLGRRFDAQLAQAIAAEGHDQSSWSNLRRERYAEVRGHEVKALGRLDIPSANVSVMVLDGTDDSTLDRAVGRIEGTAMPGDRGNLGIAGHRDAFFRHLGELSEGDELTLATPRGISRYEVTRLEVVEPTRVDVLDPTEEPTLTLVTCHPFDFIGPAPDRFIVQARQTRFERWTSERLAKYTQTLHAARMISE